MKVLAIAVLLCPCLATECNKGACADETSLMQVRTSVAKKDPKADAVELESIKSNASEIVLEAETYVSQTASDEKLAREKYFVAKRAAEKAALALKSAQSWADSAAAKVSEASRKMLAANLAAEQANATAEAATDAWNATELTSEQATAKAEAAQALAISTAKASRDAAAALTAAEANYKAVKAGAWRAKLQEDAEADEADAATAADEAATARVISEMHEEYEEEVAANASEANEEYKTATEEANTAEKTSRHAESEADHAANQAQKYDELAAGATLSEGLNTSSSSTESSGPAASQTVMTKTEISIPA